jgi:aldehyde:ferredoxin oxidoreductase
MTAEFFGVTGKLLRIDMTQEKATVVETDAEIYKTHLGGIGLGLYWLFKEGVVSPDVPPFDPKNILQIMVGPFNGIVPGTQSVAVTKSPYNFMCVSYSGGYANAEIKFAGYDGIQVVGKAKDLLWVSIVDDKVEFHDAKDLKGKDPEETEIILKGMVPYTTSPLEYRKERVLTKENLPTGKDASGKPVSMWDWWGVRSNPPYAIGEKRLAKVLSIGPAGEKGVWYANIMTEGSHAHGRYGSGAIMGSKNLKAITIRGTKGHKVKDKTRVLEIIKTILANQKLQIVWRTYGTGYLPARATNYESAYGIRNWQYIAWHDPRSVKPLTGSFLETGFWVRKDSCCSIGCQNCFVTSRVTNKDPELDGTLNDIPDWEAQGDIGGLLDFTMPDDLFPGKDPSNAKLSDILTDYECASRFIYTVSLYDRNGMDYIEGGNHISLLMELRQRNLITKEDLKLPPEVGDLIWGNHKAVAWILKQMVTSDDPLFQALRKGTYETAKYFAEKKNNPNIMYYSQTIKRYGQPAHDPRSGRCKKVDEYIQTERPGAHTEGYDAVVPFRAMYGSLVGCLFAAATIGGAKEIAALLTALTGWEYTEADVNNAGERIYCLERTFNIVTQGLTNPAEQWDNLWPRRWLEPIPSGPLAGQASQVTEAKMKELLAKFYANRGLDEKGFPKAETMAKWGIQYADEWLKKYRGS